MTLCSWHVMWVQDMSVLLTAVLFTEKGAMNNTSSDQS